MELNLLNLIIKRNDIDGLSTLAVKGAGRLWLYVADIKNMKQYEVPTSQNVRQDTDFNEAILTRSNEGNWTCVYQTGEGTPIIFDKESNREIERHYKLLKEKGKL